MAYRQGKSINIIKSYLRDLKVLYEWMKEADLAEYEVKPRSQSLSKFSNALFVSKISFFGINNSI